MSGGLWVSNVNGEEPSVDRTFGQVLRGGLAAMGDAWLGRATPGRQWWRDRLAAVMDRRHGPDPDPPEGIDELTVLVSDAPEVVRALAAAKYGADGDPWRWLGRRLGLEIRATAAWFDAEERCSGQGRRVPVVVPVPSHWARRWHRGIDHTKLLGIEIAAAIGGRRSHWLSRRWGPPQMGTDRRHRREVADQIEISTIRRLEDMLRRRHRWAPETPVLLVDDILTTGASVSACARILRRMGHESVHAAVLAAHRGSFIDELSTADPLDWITI